jgi:GDP-D-mannose 3', 5'-epimerase
MKTALCLGAGGFVCSHMVKRLKKDGYWVRGVDLKYPEFSPTEADEFVIGDLRDPLVVSRVMFAPNQRSLNDENSFDLVIQMAADMGGSLWVFTGDHDADIMHNSALINLNVCDQAVKHGVKKIFYSSSACMYPENIQGSPNARPLKESDGFSSPPDSEYGWEKLFSERLYKAYERNYGLDVRIARFHNIFGEEGTYLGDRAKAPAQLCQKVAAAKDYSGIFIFGDGFQTRSFLHISECVEGVMRLIESDYTEAVNIGSNELISINDLAKMIVGFSGKKLSIDHDLTKPQGVRGRNSDNTLIRQVLNWSPTQPLEVGMYKTWQWINKQVNG